MAEIHTLIERFDALVARKGISASTLSRKVFGGGKRIDEIRAGSSVTLSTFARAHDALAEMERAA